MEIVWVTFSQIAEYEKVGFRQTGNTKWENMLSIAYTDYGKPVLLHELVR